MIHLPAWSSAFAPDALQTLEPVPHIDEITAQWAWGDGRGAGVKVAVIDSGIDAAHPALGGTVQGYAEIVDDDGDLIVRTEPHDDAVGHGTACAGIIRSLAPACELFSVKVLGQRLAGRGTAFAAGLRWAIEHNMQVCNLSLGTTRREFYAVLHELTDLATFRNVILVAAANNMPVPSFPSLYASVISVAAHELQDPLQFFFNPQPPVEFGALGINVRVPWRDGQWVTVTGNSYAAPHIAGIVARILGEHPGLTQFQVKTILRALSANVRRADAASQ
jgi:subtilisin family serine protease